jgi:hypothetical protein
MLLVQIIPSILLGLAVSPEQLAAWEKLQQSAASKVAAATRQPPPGVLGAPRHFSGLHIGPYELGITRSDVVTGSEISFGVRRLSNSPDCFHLRGLLSEAECDLVSAAVEDKNMAPAMTAGGDARTGCGVAWLSVDTHPVARELAGVFGELLLSPEARDPSNWGRGAGFEKLQVLRYQESGEFKLHMDANEETPRMLTVLLYLNGRGETWFPLADADVANPRSRLDALRICAGKVPGEDGLLVSPPKGDAIAFYNYCDDGTGALNRRALHAGLPAPDGKEVAAMWYQLDPWQDASRLRVTTSTERQRAMRGEQRGGRATAGAGGRKKPKKALHSESSKTKSVESSKGMRGRGFG